MPDIVNPYTPGQPIRDPDLFFGRAGIIASIRENLVKGRRVFLVSGARRTGRTSLLHQLPSHLPEECVGVQVELLEEEGRQLDSLL
jgi:predicted AAA+ superfamily ATPase